MPNADPNETLARWARYDLERRERKLDSWLRIITIATICLIGFASTDIFYTRFFYYQQLGAGTYISHGKYDTFTLCRLVMGIAMANLVNSVPFQTKEVYQYKKHSAYSRIIAALVFFITVLINHFANSPRINEPRILTIYHWTQTITYISIVVINRLLFALIIRCKKLPYKGTSPWHAKFLTVTICIILFLELIASFSSGLFPKFFY